MTGYYYSKKCGKNHGYFSHLDIDVEPTSFSTYSSREEIYSSRSSQISLTANAIAKNNGMSNKLNVHNKEQKRQSLNEGLFQNVIQGQSYYQCSPEDIVQNSGKKTRSVSTMMPYRTEKYVKNVKGFQNSKLSLLKKVQNSDEKIFNEAKYNKTVRRKTEFFPNNRINLPPSNISMQPQCSSARSSGEYTDMYNMWNVNKVDHLSPERYKDSQVNSSLNVPGGNLIKSKSYNSLQVKNDDYRNMNANDIINAETLVVPSNIGIRLTRYKSYDTSDTSIYPSESRNFEYGKDFGNKINRRKYSHDTHSKKDTDSKEEKSIWSQAILSLKKKQEAFFRKLPKPRQDEENLVPTESDIDPVYHFLRCGSYTNHDAEGCECPCHTKSKEEFMKHAQSHLELPSLPFKTKHK